METEELFESIEEEDEEEWLRQLRRKKRIEDMRRQKQRAQWRHRLMLCAISAVLFFGGIGASILVLSALNRNAETSKEDNRQNTDAGRKAGTGQGAEAGQGTGMGQGADASQQAGTGQQEVPPQGSGAGQASAEPQSALFQSIQALLAGEWNPLVPEAAEEDSGSEAPEYNIPVFTAHSTDATAAFDESIVSEYGILVDVEDGVIVACRNPYTRISPASMTKVLTVLTAAEILGIEDESSPVLEESFTMTIEITDYCYVHDCSIAGFGVGEEISVRDLFYGTILPSGADAAVGLAVYAAGSHEEFVERMNEKLAGLRLSETTHFTNCVGLYDENHYSTVYDIAMILKEAADNEFCRQVLSAHTYTTSLTEEHPKGMLLSNWFLRRIEDRDTHGEVICGKTGFVNQSGSCAASLAADIYGREYLCVTAHSSSSWKCIADQTELYQTFLAGGGDG